LTANLEQLFAPSYSQSCRCSPPGLREVISALEIWRVQCLTGRKFRLA